MPDPTDPALALVHEGWDHLKQQRPLAAWASWRRALRVEPEQPAATHALHVLANAGDLPEAARLEYRFLTPVGADQRARWDARFRGRDLEELAVAAGAFGSLAEDDPADSRARFNQGLCLAWLGRNAEAVAALERAVDLFAGTEPEVAEQAWTLAEVLRQGGGAEPLADDLNHVALLAWTPGDDPAGFLDDRPDVRPIPNPIDPVTGQPRLSEARIYEWLDRPWSTDSDSLPTCGGGLGWGDVGRGLDPEALGDGSSGLAEPPDHATPPSPQPSPARGEGARPEGRADEPSSCLRRVRATVIRSPHSLRLSGTDPVLLEEAVAEVARLAGPRVASARREASPLPLAFLDADVWAIRMPPGLDEEARGRLNRSAVERYYEHAWIHRPRQGLGGRSPAEAGRLASDGDAALGSKLSAVVRLREQLGTRPTTALLYQGYPFDRLRRRLGLPPTDPDAIDPQDATSMSGPELDRLDPSALDDYALADAYESAAALGDDRRTARFAGVLAGRDPLALARLDVRALFATLVRAGLAEDAGAGALGRIDRAQAVDLALTGGRDFRTYETWRAEVFVRLGEAEDAVRVYRALLEASSDPVLALDAAETLRDAGFDDPARILAEEALSLAKEADRPELVEMAEAYLVDG